MKISVRQYIIAIAAAFCMASNAAPATDDFDCLIEPWQKVDLSFAEKGLISALQVQQGQIVKKGQLLATLDSALEQANVDLAAAKASMDDEIKALQTTLAYNQRNVTRLRELFKQKAMPISKVDEAETETAITEQRLRTAQNTQRLAELELKLAQELLKRRQLTSPLDGTVVKVHKEPGEYEEYEPVLTLEQFNPLRVQVLLPVTLFGKIPKTTLAKITPELPIGDKELLARVVVVDSGVDVASGTFGIQLELDNTDLSIPTGLKCSLQFIYDGNSTPATSSSNSTDP